MRFLDAIAPARSAAGESRYSFQQYVHDVIGSGFGGSPITTTWGGQPTEPISDTFAGLVGSGLKSNAIIAALESNRVSVFSQVRFQFQEIRNGRTDRLFDGPQLRILEHPWVGGTTGDLLARMILDADFAGNFYGASIGGEIVRLRPDWVEILLAPRMAPLGKSQESAQVGFERVAYVYYEGGKGVCKTPAYLLPEDVCHFAPLPDPMYTYRGMSWLTPVIREIQADTSATKHKLKFFENAATPNLAVSLPKEITPDQFNEFVSAMDAAHRGGDNAYKTLYTAGGADVTVVGANMAQLDFKVTQGAGETRLAAAAMVPAVIAGLSEGLSGSSLNEGNYSAAKRRFADGTMAWLWRNAVGSLETIVPPPQGSRLWFDTRDVSFMREDNKDLAETQRLRGVTIRNLLDAGYDPDAVVQALDTDDFNLLTGKHSGLFSVQLQRPGSGGPPNGQEPGV